MLDRKDFDHAKNAGIPCQKNSEYLKISQAGKQISEASLSLNRSYYQNIEKLIYWSNFPVSSAKNEADEIIRPVILAVKAYDNAFNQNYSQALLLVDRINSDPTALSTFKTNMNDIYINVRRINDLAITAENQLNVLRQRTTAEISSLATQISQANLEKMNLENQISRLEDEIAALERELSDLNNLWWLCILGFFCVWLVPLIQQVGYNKNQRQAELRQRTSELVQVNIRLTQLTATHASLVADHQNNLQTLVYIQRASGTCIFILNNITGILELLLDIDSGTPNLLRRQLTVLKQNWDDLVSEMDLLTVALAIKLNVSCDKYQGEHYVSFKS